MSLQLKDKFGRIHDYLRISLTDKCNLSCTYCMPKNPCYFPKGSLLTYEEIYEIAKIFVIDFGIKKIRLTGGEPLVRKNVEQIIEALSSLSVELSITTNGVLLNSFIPLFKRTGLTSINISLDTLKPERFFAITKNWDFDKVMNNINQLMEEQFYIKINTVVIKDINEDEIIDFVEWTRDIPIHVRFIEFMPFDGNKWQWKKVVSYNAILERIKSIYSIEKLHDTPNTTSKSFRIDGFSGTFAIISSVTAPFCDSCNRLRLTADGKFRSCIFAPKETDILCSLRKGGDIRELIKRDVLNKAFKTGGLPEFQNQQKVLSNLSARSMVMMGG